MTSPLHVFRFDVSLGDGAPASEGGRRDAASEPPAMGFSDCTGLEATMEPKVIKEGGRNFGAIQRPGPVTFGTVILKRGMIRNVRLWEWFTEATSQGAYHRRRDVTITLRDTTQVIRNKKNVVIGYRPAMTWVLKRAMPIKFKTADLNARATEVGIEELHLAHEGLRVSPGGD